jgi:hypothetical protein
MMLKRSKNEGRPPNFCEFWSEELYYIETSKNKTLMFECYFFLDPMEGGVVIFLS